MKRPEHLTEAEARTLTRGEILDRVEAEQAYWLGLRRMPEEGHAACRELMQIMHRYVNLSESLNAAIDLAEGRRGPDYWETVPGEQP